MLKIDVIDTACAFNLSASLPLSVLALCSTVLMTSPALAQADTVTPAVGKPVQAKGDMKARRVLRKKSVTRNVKPSVSSTRETIVTVVDEEDLSTARAKALDKKFGLKGWNIPWPSFGETLDRDHQGYRTTLAKYGFSVLAYDSTILAENTLKTPVTNNGAQVYNGQRPTFTHNNVIYLNYDLSQWGVPDGQIQTAGFFYQDSWKPLGAELTSLYRLAYYQTLFDRKLEVNFGYMAASTVWVGNFLAGQIFNPFGPSASIPVEAGLSSGPDIQPVAFANYHAGDFYDKFGAARSISPTASAVLNEGLQNPAMTRFSEPGHKTAFVNEVGYKTAASATSMSTWVRAGGIYNDSLYHNYATGGMSTNHAAYLLADRQLTKIGDTSRGIYAGLSAMYAPPETNVYSQYYEGRLYAIGLFDARPQDTISAIYAHNAISSAYADPVNAAAVKTGTFAADDTNTITASYVIHVTRGAYLTLGLSYTDHPSVGYIAHEGPALNFLASSFIVF